eukprot:scaffold31952_cov19-Tisochrysis_lutea.AAC.1
MSMRQSSLSVWGLRKHRRMLPYALISDRCNDAECWPGAKKLNVHAGHSQRAYRKDPRGAHFLDTSLSTMLSLFMPDVKLDSQ